MTAERVDVHAVAVGVTGVEHPKDRYALAREGASPAPSRERLRRTITATHDTEVVAKARAELQKLTNAPSDAEREGFWSAAQVAESGKGKTPSYREVLPRSASRDEAAAKKAGEALPPKREEQAKAQKKVAEEHATRASGLEKTEPSSVLKRKVRIASLKVAAFAAVLWGACLGVFALYYGVFDENHVVSRQEWVNAALASVTSGLTELAYASLGAALLSTFARPSKSVALLLALLVSGLMVRFYLAQVDLRWAASFTGTSFTTAVATRGSDAIGTISWVSAVVVTGAMLRAELRLCHLVAQRDEASRVERLYADRVAMLEAAYQTATAEVTALEAIVNRPAEIEAAFEQAILVLRRVRLEMAPLLEARLAAAEAAFDGIASLDYALRCRVVDVCYEIRPVEPENRAARSVTSGILHSAAIVAFALTTLLSGCSRPPSAPLLLACDGTGGPSTCSPALVARAFVGSIASRGPHGYTIIMSGGSLAETKTFGPYRFAGERGGFGAWMADTLPVLASLPVPMDVPGEEAINKSDVLALLVESGRWSNNVPGTMVDLVLATDGWSISPWLPANLTKAVPPVADVVRALGKHVPEPKRILSRVRSLRICGLDPRGAPELVTRRDAFFRELPVALGGPPPEVLTSCALVYPDVVVPPLTTAHAQ